MSDQAHIVKILSKKNLTHDVLCFQLERPDGFEFSAGQGVEVAIPKGDEVIGGNPFTLTGLADLPYLELIIKIYHEREGFTHALSTLEVGEKLQISDAWDSFSFEGDGTFIAGGAGITPFLAILREQQQKNNLSGQRLIFANKTSKDIICEKELNEMLGKRFINFLSQERHDDYHHGILNHELLTHHIGTTNQKFYICGPEGFSESVGKALVYLGVNESDIFNEY